MYYCNHVVARNIDYKVSIVRYTYDMHNLREPN